MDAARNTLTSLLRQPPPIPEDSKKKQAGRFAGYGGCGAACSAAPMVPRVCSGFVWLGGLATTAAGSSIPASDTTSTCIKTAVITAGVVSTLLGTGGMIWACLELAQNATLTALVVRFISSNLQGKIKQLTDQNRRMYDNIGEMRGLLESGDRFLGEAKMGRAEFAKSVDGAIAEMTVNEQGWTNVLNGFDDTLKRLQAMTKGVAQIQEVVAQAKEGHVNAEDLNRHVTALNDLVASSMEEGRGAVTNMRDQAIRHEKAGAEFAALITALSVHLDAQKELSDEVNKNVNALKEQTKALKELDKNKEQDFERYKQEAQKLRRLIPPAVNTIVPLQERIAELETRYDDLMARFQKAIEDLDSSADEGDSGDSGSENLKVPARARSDVELGDVVSSGAGAAAAPAPTTESDNGFLSTARSVWAFFKG